MEWACQSCHECYFGTPPDTGLCIACESVYVSLTERSTLVGGEPGSGKSGRLQQIAIDSVLFPEIDLTAIDGKQLDQHAPKEVLRT